MKIRFDLLGCCFLAAVFTAAAPFSCFAAETASASDAVSLLNYMDAYEGIIFMMRICFLFWMIIMLLPALLLPVTRFCQILITMSYLFWPQSVPPLRILQRTAWRMRLIYRKYRRWHCLLLVLTATWLFMRVLGMALPAAWSSLPLTSSIFSSLRMGAL